MTLLLLLFCFSTFLQASLSTPLLAAKPKPVNLAFNCMIAIDPNNSGLKLDEVPIILLHGLTGNKETWHGVFETLAFSTKKKVCAVDLRNHGQSPWVDEEYNVIAMTEDVKKFIDEMNVPKAVVLGHSMGGRIAVHLALNYPENVEKIIVEDMRPNGLLPDALKGVQIYAQVLKDVAKNIPQGVNEREAKEAFITLMRDHLSKMNIPFTVEDLTVIPVKCSDGKCQLSVNPVVLDAAIRNMDELLNESSGRFDKPELFIYGAESPFKVGDDESNIKKLFPNSELVAVEGADHTVHTHKKFVTEVLKFIKSK